MADPKPVIVLVHGAFAESASWNGVVTELRAYGHEVVAAANPLRSLAGDAQYLVDVVNGLGDRPAVLVGHSYGGMVTTEAASSLSNVSALVYVGAFAPDTGESALELSSKFPGSSLGDALIAYPVATGGDEVRIEPEKYHHQFCADVDDDLAAVMAVTQRPVTQAALTDGLVSANAAWKSTPSWFVHGDADLNIPPESLRFMADRAGSVHTEQLEGASHSLAASQPRRVADVIGLAVARAAG